MASSISAAAINRLLGKLPVMKGCFVVGGEDKKKKEPKKVKANVGNSKSL